MLAMKTIIADLGKMASCIKQRGDLQRKFDRLQELLIKRSLAVMNEAKPIQTLIGELVNDMGDVLPATSASALIDVSCLAESKEEYLQAEERCRF